MSSKTYLDKLRDVRWQKRRLEVLERANWMCEECRISLMSGVHGILEVHHVHYMQGKDPWDYPLQLLMSLCPKHHAERQAVEQDILVAVACVMRDKTLEELKQMPIYPFVGCLHE